MIAYYDLAASPPTYDIVAFLCAVEQERIARGETSIEIRVIPGPVGGFRSDKYWPFTIAGRELMLDHVALPMARMLPSATVMPLMRRPDKPEMGSVGWGGGWYGLTRHVKAHAKGIRPLRLAEEVKKSDRLVTITLREAEHWPERNSNVSEWLDAAEDIDRAGYDVRIIRDTCQAGKPLSDYDMGVRASRDFNERARLYTSAVCNLFVNNGPAWFAMALDAPVLMLKPVVENLMSTSSSGYFARCGIPSKGQMPGSPSYQRIVWQEDTRDNIVAAFKNFMATPWQKEFA